MEISHAKEAHLLEVLYIVRECAFQLLEKGVRYWHNSHADYADIHRDIKDKKVFILFYKKMAVGTVTLKPSPAVPGQAEVSRLAVLPPFQRRGFAKALLQQAEVEAKVNGFEALRGVTAIDEPSTTKLFREAGYEPIGVGSGQLNEAVGVVFGRRLV